MTEPVPSDERLLEAARAGDMEALETLLERHQAQVYRFDMKMCRHTEDAKDVLCARAGGGAGIGQDGAPDLPRRECVNPFVGPWLSGERRP